MENAATHFKSSDVDEDYHCLKYRRQVSFLNCLIHPFPKGSICACSRSHLQTARLFHSNHMSQSYLYHLTFTPFLELTMSLSLLFIVLGSADLNLWQGATDPVQGATDPVQFQATIGESVAPCHGLVNSFQGAIDSIEMWNGAI
ncbi:hypothetical protein PIB30_019458 [Stylosanthes scabra]|uniref:Uncharacterized protein n=1 Tax=Stylosanthes scabra TaxID=79078 RepID=A0ABU6S8V9_9FABA|nr:hypothetical protein [Stylosanthes scabra]